MTDEKSAYEGLMEQSTPPPRYTIRTAADALQPQPPIDWVIGEGDDGLIPSPGFIIVYGAPGSKKTYATLSMGVCVALGKDWLHLGTSQRPVLIVDEESGPLRMARRLGETLRGELGGTDAPIYYVSLAGFILDNKKRDDVLELEKLITETRAGLVIVDALADIMGGDENSKQDIQPVMNDLQNIAHRQNTTIVLIHHSNKSGGYRGSSAMEAAADMLLQVKSDEQDGDYIEFKAMKTRDIKRVTFGAIAHWENGEFYLTPTNAKPKAPSKSAAWLLEYLTNHGPTSTPDLMAAAEAAGVCKAGTAKKAIQFLAAEKSIFRTNPNDAGRGIEAIYDIPSKHDEQA